MSFITKNKSKLYARLREKLPEQNVGLVPADAFFTRKVDLPEGLKPDEKEAFIQLNLEGNSPFPMEQLAWGYLDSPNSSHAFAYASAKARLRRLGFDNPKNYLQLFPGFITLFGESLEDPTVRFVSQNGVLAAIFLNPGNPVPTRVVSRPVKGELLTDEIQLQAREELLGQLSHDGFSAEDGLWLGEGSKILSSGVVRFLHRHVSATHSQGLHAHEMEMPDSKLWAADLRDANYATQESNTRQRSSLIWKALRFSVWAAIFLLIVQVLDMGVSGFNLLRDRKIQKIEPQAVRVENKITLADRLTQSTEEDLKPFLLMEAINGIRPDSVFFNKVRSRAFNELEIEGESPEGVTPVNAFADSVAQLPFVQAVENNPRTRNKQTSFELVITFSELPPEPEGGFILPEVIDEESPKQETE